MLSVVLSSSLYQMFAKTQAGSRFASKTRQALEQLRTNRTHVLVYAGGYFEIFETSMFVRLVLRLTAHVQERLRYWLEEHLDSIKKQE